jgi:hypothetical protein
MDLIPIKVLLWVRLGKFSHLRKQVLRICNSCCQAASVYARTASV